MVRPDDTTEAISRTRFADTLFAADGPSWTLRFGAATHTGLVRKRNEDQYAVVRRRRASDVMTSSFPVSQKTCDHQEAWILMVADGIGGAAQGDVASRLTIESILDSSARSTSWINLIRDMDAQQLRERIEAYMDEVQKVLHDHVAWNPRARGMGTTLTSLVVTPPEALVVHIGDSRAYRFRDGRLRQLTRDQTIAQELIEAGMQPDDVRSFGHLLTNGLGAGLRHPHADIQHLRLETGDQLLLCSDGLSDLVDPDEICKALQTDNPGQACDLLINQALEAGGRDNITAIVAIIDENPGSSPSQQERCN